MGQFFGSIYCWLEDFFGIDLANYLWGQSSPESTTNSFIGIGLSMVGITLFMVIAFYYVVNHPRLNNWWGWSIFILGNAVINFFVGWQMVLKDYYDDLMFSVDPSTNMKVPLNISETNIVCFGVSNMLLSILFFLVISYVVKWGSSNCSRAPFSF